MASSPLSASVSLQSTRTWPGLRSEHSWLAPHEGATTTKPNQIGIAFSGHRGLVQSHAGKERASDVDPGAAFITGSESITWLRVREQTDALELYPDAQLLCEIAGDSLARIEIRPSLGRSDSVVFAIASIFRRIHLTNGQLSDVAASTLAARLAGRLLSLHGNVAPAPSRTGGLLDERQLTRACAYIDADLGGLITVNAIARAADLSVSHFSRSFERTTGLAPHRYVTARRMDAAKTMLMETKLSVGAIATRVGFANLSHFRRVFRTHFGVAPNALRS